MPIEYRNDDVLLTYPMTGSMKNCLRHNTYFGHFKETDKLFKNTKCTLAILADGIDKNPEWVEYIKENQDRYNIEMHGWHHVRYSSLSKEEGCYLLLKAKKKIEETFNIEVTRWYVPFGKVYYPKWGKEVCDLIGIGFDYYGLGYRQKVFHYWNSRDRNRLKQWLQT
jgi:peptidoglycan/xylan/chitin deacetylase (PgdA/CDA1 family)